MDGESDLVAVVSYRCSCGEQVTVRADSFRVVVWDEDDTDLDGPLARLHATWSCASCGCDYEHEWYATAEEIASDRVVPWVGELGGDDLCVSVGPQDVLDGDGQPPEVVSQ